MIIEEIRAVLAAKASALVRRSADDMAALMHPDFVHVTAGGRTLTKADYIDVFINSDRVVYHSQEVRELEVHLFDAVAVATMAVDDRCSIDGREITETFRALSVYTWKDGRWLWVAGQTALPRLPCLSKNDDATSHRAQRRANLAALSEDRQGPASGIGRRSLHPEVPHTHVRPVCR